MKNGDSLYKFVLSVVLSVAFVATVVSATTTISTNVVTDGVVYISTSTGYANLSIGGSAVGTSLAVLDALTSQTAAILDVKLASTTKFSVSSAGYTAVASTSPWALFSVNPNALGSGVPEFAIGSTSATRFVVTGSGKVGIGSTTPYVTLGITGTTTSSTGAVIGAGSTPLNNILFGFCTITGSASITASSTLDFACTGSGDIANVTSNYNIFIQATSSMPIGIFVRGASTTSTGSIQLELFNSGIVAGATAPGNVSVRVIAVQ